MTEALGSSLHSDTGSGLGSRSCGLRIKPASEMALGINPKALCEPWVLPAPRQPHL